MPSEETQARHAFSELLAELTDSDVIVEVKGTPGSRRTPQLPSVQKVRDAIDASYRALAGTIEADLETVAVLEEIQKRSLSMWLRVKTAGMPAEGSAEEGSEASLLKFLARGTLTIIAWMDGSATQQLTDLQQAIRVLAWGTSITTTAHPVLPSSTELVDAISAWQEAKAAFESGDTVRIYTNNGSTGLDLSKRVENPKALLLARKLVNHSADMIFVVEMPDYQASGQWQLKHGDTRTVAYSEPGTLLDKFYRRELDIRPGDALRCRVDFETSYGPDHEVISERYRIVEILEVLPTSRPGGEPAGLPAERPRERESTPELETTDS